VTVKDSEIREIQFRYRHLVNYDETDPDAPIDPLTYVDTNGDHLIHIAARSGDLDTVKLLLEEGVNPNLLGDMGCTPLHYARMEAKADVADLLLSRGASLSIKNLFGDLP
jgi:ankyrin repeat protein